MRFAMPPGNQETWNWEEIDLTHEVTTISSPDRYMHPLEVIPPETEELTIHEMAALEVGTLVAIVPRNTHELYLAEIISSRLAAASPPAEGLGEVEVRFANGETERYRYWYRVNSEIDLGRTPTANEEKLWKEYHSNKARTTSQDV